MGTLNTVKTRIGVAGPSPNYTRPFTAKSETEAPEIPEFQGFLRNVSKVGKP